MSKCKSFIFSRRKGIDFVKDGMIPKKKIASHRVSVAELHCNRDMMLVSLMLLPRDKTMSLLLVAPQGLKIVMNKSNKFVTVL